MVLVVPMYLLGGLAAWLGFTDGVLHPVSLSSQVLGLSYLLVGAMALAAAVALCSCFAAAIWPRAAFLGGALAVYIGLSLALRIAGHSVVSCVVLGILGSAGLLVAGIGAYDIATNRSAAFGTPLKALAAGLGVAITLGQLWYTAIYQPNSAVAGINVTPKVGTLHAGRRGIGLVPLSITVSNDSSYEVVLLDTWWTLQANYYTPPPKGKGPKATPKVSFRSLQLGPFFSTPYYLPPNASVSSSAVIPIFHPRAESFTLTPQFAYVRASQPGFDKLIFDARASRTLRAVSTTNHCYSGVTVARVYQLHESALQSFTHGNQVLVTDVCQPIACPKQQPTPDHPLSACLIAKVVSNSPADIRELRNPRDVKITFGSRVQTFLAQQSLSPTATHSFP